MARKTKDEAHSQCRWDLGDILTPDKNNESRADIAQRDCAASVLERLLEIGKLSISEVEDLSFLCRMMYSLGQLDYRLATNYDVLLKHDSKNNGVYLRSTTGEQLPESAEYYVLRGDSDAPQSHVEALLQFARAEGQPLMERKLIHHLDLVKKSNPKFTMLEKIIES